LGADSNVRITDEKHQKDIALQEKAVALGHSQQQASHAHVDHAVGTSPAGF
jgi:hypothetical protein